MNKYYVIGHLGYIGKEVVSLLKSEEVVYLSREDFSQIGDGKKKLEFNSGDILLNLAWDNLDNFRSPLHMTDTLAEHIKFYDKTLEMGLKNITAVGTCLEYGVVEGELNEDMVSNPTLPYAIAKDSLRKYLDFKKKMNGDFNFNWIRLFYMYGEDQSKRTIFGQLKLAIARGNEVFDMSLGKQKRDYLHVKEVAKIILQIASTHKSYGVINCCSGAPVTMIDFIENRMKELGKSLTLNLGKFSYADYEALEFWGSVGKMNKILEQIKSFK